MLVLLPYIFEAEAKIIFGYNFIDSLLKKMFILIEELLIRNFKTLILPFSEIVVFIN